jgi:hypothetical protein
VKRQSRIGVNQYAIPFAARHNEAFESGSGNHREDSLLPLSGLIVRTWQPLMIGLTGSVAALRADPVNGQP